MNIVYVSDFLYSEVSGGAEYNDKEILKFLSNTNKVIFVKSYDLNFEILEKYKKFNFIFSNFALLSSALIDYIIKNINYIIYEHDHKYCADRNPATYVEFSVPKEKIVNYEFYKNSKKVFVQTSFHKKIIEKNLQLDNIYNVSGNFWSEEDLNYISTLSKNTNKKDVCSILDSELNNKNKQGAIEYCKKNNLQYEILTNLEYKLFLRKISENNKFIFLPSSPETLSRIVVESKMLNNKVVVNKLVGARYENWFDFSGEEIIEYMKNLKQRVINEIEKSF